MGMFYGLVVVVVIMPWLPTPDPSHAGMGDVCRSPAVGMILGEGYQPLDCEAAGLAEAAEF